MATKEELNREAWFYRRTLEQICKERRNTLAKRLASSALTFWDEMQREKRKRQKIRVNKAYAFK